MMDYHPYDMHLVKTVRAWGNVLAVPLSRREAAALGIRPGDEVDLEVRPHRAGVNLADLPTLDLGSHGLDLDRVAEDEAGGDA